MPILESIGFNSTAFAINIVGFLILLFILNKFLFGPVGKMLAERQSDIAGTYAKLDADQREMQALKADYEKRLDGIEAEARERIAGAIKDAQAARDQIVSEAGSRSKEMIAQAEEEIRRDQEKAMVSLREQVVALTLGATQKILGENLDETRQRRLINNFITEQAPAATTTPGVLEA